MNLVDLKHEDLIKPDQFEVVSSDQLFDQFVSLINDELQNILDDGTEFYDNVDSHINVVINGDDFSPEITDALIANMIELYQSIGWAKVTSQHFEESEDEYDRYEFDFYFKILPGTNTRMSL